MFTRREQQNKMKRFFLVGIFLSVSIIIFSGNAFSEDTDYYYRKANVFLSSGKMREAVNNYNEVLRKDKNFFEAYIGLSIAYRETGQYDKALKSADCAIKLKPDYYQAYYNKGLILERQNKCTEALNAYGIFLKKTKGAAEFSDVKQRISKIKQHCEK